MTFTSADYKELATPADTDDIGSPLSTTETEPRKFPRHPIPQLQGPFEESILEADEEGGDKWVVDLDAQAWRRDLLEKPEYERLCGRKWRQRPGERYHPFWKLISNMSFGVYLLATGLAKSEMEVLRILQSYVDELDEFIERGTDDFLIIQVDIRTRIQYLSMPLGNLDIFDEMLDDRSFRLAMMDYNEKIEHAIDRFTMAIRDSLNDIQKGREAIGALYHFIGRLDQKANSPSNNLDDICYAMLENIEGWNAALWKLHKNGMRLDSALVQLGMAVVEMQRRVGVASRRSVVPFAEPPNRPSRSKSLSGRLFQNGRPVTAIEPNKPLPRDPDLLDAARGRPGTGRPTTQRTTAKSAPNLRATNKSRRFNESRDANCMKPAHSGEDAEADDAAPKPQRGLSKRFLKPAHAKGAVGKKSENTQTRPATAHSKPLRSRSISLEHLKAMCVPKKLQQETMAKSSNSPPRPGTTNTSARRDNLKDQVLRHVRSDKVPEAWENTVSKKKKPPHHHPLQKTRDWPRSIFRPKSSSNRHNRHDPGKQEAGLADTLGGKMSWLEEEPEPVNTYFSLKSEPKRDEAPKFHLPSTEGNLAESVAETSANNHGNKGNDGEPDSSITALPLLPLPLEGRWGDGPGNLTDSVPKPSSVTS